MSSAPSADTGLPAAAPDGDARSSAPARTDVSAAAASAAEIRASVGDIYPPPFFRMKKVKEPPKPLKLSFPNLTVQFLIAFALLFLYLFVGTLAYRELESSWSITESLYFCFVTMSTVGYGDLFPSSTGSRVFTVFMIFFGIIVVFTRVANVVGAGMRPITSCGRALLERVWPEFSIDINGDGKTDFRAPRGPVIFYFKHLMPSVVLNVLLQLFSAGIFVVLEKDWSYGTAFYHCLVTATTVGYGDVSIDTEGGRQWACAHIMLSVVMLAELITTMGDLHEERKKMLRTLSQLTKRLSPGLIDNLLKHAIELRPEKKSEGVSELEFAMCMMLELGIITLDDVHPFIRQFQALDANEDRCLNHEDLRHITKNRAQQDAWEAALKYASKHIGVTEAKEYNLPRERTSNRIFEELQGIPRTFENIPMPGFRNRRTLKASGVAAPEPPADGTPRTGV